MADLRLRPATANDRFLIRRWLADPMVRGWWADVASAEAEITLAFSSEAALPRIIERDGVPIGYTQAVEVGLWADQRPDGVPAGTWGVDCFLASRRSDSRDTAAAALDLLTQEVFATTLAVACSAVVSIRNETAVRAYEQAGFRWQQIWPDPALGTSWLMLKERPGFLPVR